MHHSVKKLWCFTFLSFLLFYDAVLAQVRGFSLTAALGHQNKRIVSVVLSCTDKWAPKWCEAAKSPLPQVKEGLASQRCWRDLTRLSPFSHTNTSWSCKKKKKKGKKMEKVSLMSFKLKLWSRATTYPYTWREVIVYAATRLSCRQNLFFQRNPALLLFPPL